MDITVSSKGQVVIPREIRKKYDIDRGTKLKVTESDGLVILIPPVKMASLCGTWKLDKKQIEKAIREGREDWR
jgi:AbrB family looped-hinge helix DNA binding protein